MDVAVELPRPVLRSQGRGPDESGAHVPPGLGNHPGGPQQLEGRRGRPDGEVVVLRNHCESADARAPGDVREPGAGGAQGPRHRAVVAVGAGDGPPGGTAGEQGLQDGLALGHRQAGVEGRRHQVLCVEGEGGSVRDRDDLPGGAGGVGGRSSSAVVDAAHDQDEGVTDQDGLVPGVDLVQLRQRARSRWVLNGDQPACTPQPIDCNNGELQCRWGGGVRLAFVCPPARAHVRRFIVVRTGELQQQWFEQASIAWTIDCLAIDRRHPMHHEYQSCLHVSE